MDIKFEGGINIAVKIPKAKYEATVHFYRDILKLNVEEKPITNPTVSRTHEVRFGSNVMWLDCVDNYTHSETWLELNVENVPAATEYLKSHGISTCDELKNFPTICIGSPIPQAQSILLKTESSLGHIN